MTDSPLFLALDVGSQSSRALLFDAAGRVLDQGQRLHAPMRRPEPEAVEQDPGDIRGALWGAIADLRDRNPGALGRTRAAALTTQRNAILPLDAQGQPLHDLVSWLDRRSARPEREERWDLRLLMATLGDRALVTRLLCKSVPRILCQRDASLRARIHRVAPLEAWLLQELTGRLAAAPGGYLGVWPLDRSKRRWGPAALARALGFEPEWLPDIVEAQAEVGRVREEVAADLGLPVGLPFFACGGDKQAEVLGAGIRVGQAGIAGVSLGTAASVTLPWPKPRASLRFEWLTNAAVEPGAWSLESMVFRGMWTARWFAEQFGGELRPQADAEGLPVEALLAREAEAVPPGAEGLSIWPRWFPSLQDPDESGVVVGLRDFHRRAHLFRALLEGLAFDLRRGVEQLQDVTGQPITELRVGGGGARSPLVLQILRDVTGLPIRCPPSSELAARGAAIVAAVGSGHFPDAASAVRAMVPDAPLQAPDPTAAAAYARWYRAVWLPGLGHHEPAWRAHRRVEG